MKIACGKYEITILKIQPVTKHITYFCGVIQFKYSSKKQVSKTGQQNRIQVSEVKNTDCSNMENVSYELKGQLYLAIAPLTVNHEVN